MVKLREIEEKDNQAIGDIVQTCLEQEGLKMPGTAYYDPYLFSLYAYYQKPDRQYWVLEKEGRVIGGVGVGPFSATGTVGEIQKLYIQKEERGKGYAHMLMEKALAFGKERYDALYIETFASLSDANHLYKKYGFEELTQPLEGTEHSACDTWLLTRFK
ncbi:MAG: GNAT family N-acetyltransferase [Alkalibacterium sp.]|nr:GNAT family N-acetyltransferase [Alkalibacterium sp.]